MYVINWFDRVIGFNIFFIKTGEGMAFDPLGKKKKIKSQEELELEREIERAWALYGKEVDAFLNNTANTAEFEKLEKSKYARPKVEIQVAHTQKLSLSDDIKKLVEGGEIQASKAYRFMVNPELKSMLAKKEESLPDELVEKVLAGEIQESKARRFMINPELRKMLNGKFYF